MANSCQPSRLLREALDCLQQCQGQRFYRWELPAAVLHVQYGLREAQSKQLPLEARQQLLALANFQRGRVRQAFADLQLPWQAVDDWIRVAPFRFFPERFVCDMRQLIHALEIRGY